MYGPIASPKHENHEKHENHKQGDHAAYKQPQPCVVSGRHSARRLHRYTVMRHPSDTASLVFFIPHPASPAIRAGAGKKPIMSQKLGVPLY
jgi:hypothetical protein